MKSIRLHRGLPKKDKTTLQMSIGTVITMEVPSPVSSLMLDVSCGDLQSQKKHIAIYLCD
jgi:hypothetical protein